MRTPTLPLILTAAVLTSGATAFAAQPAAAVQASQPNVVNAVPASYTPDVNNGIVYAIGQTGSTVVLGGSFTSVSPHASSTTYAANYVTAFTAGTGALVSGFAPTVNGTVNTVVAGPTAGTVYVGGSFTQVDGVTTRVALINAATGAIVSGWKAPPINSAVTKVVVADGQLFVGGSFTSVGGSTRDGLVSLNPTTGALTSVASVPFTGHHNYNVHCNPSAQTCADGAVGIKSLDVNPAGTRLIAIGNFTSVAGSPRDQIALLDLTSTAATLDSSWATDAYTAGCFSNAFDSYIRDVQFSPDGSYFVVVATGGSGTNSDGTNSSCDTAARYETSGTGSDVRPSWIDYTGQDSFWSVAVTGTAVYAGGHQRWLNNSHGYDYAGPGAVPRPGIAAMDPINGMPLSWNPGRQPRGDGAYALLATSLGLYVGSDTDYIGDYTYHHKKIAFFPLAGGETLASQATPNLPGRVYAAGPLASGASSGVLYRVDTGGPEIAATDNGPNWQADESDPSPYRNSGSNIAGYSPVSNVDSTVPSSTPPAIFNSERWDPGSQGDGGEMHWSFPVPSGVTVDVRLYFANRYTGTSQVGQRVFDVAIDGQAFLDHFDIVAAAGDQTGTMRDEQVTSNGQVTIDFAHEVENPLINGIEIVQKSPAPPAAADPTSLTERHFDGTTATAPQTVNAGIDWSGIRGAFMLNGELYYGRTDGNLYERTYDGSTFGTETEIDPYDDPRWDSVQTGSGQTYQGQRSTLAAELPNLSSMFFTAGRIYYTIAGDSSMHWRWFEPDDGVVGSDEFTINDGNDWSDVAGAFLSGSTLYFADHSTGALSAVAWSNGQAGGAPTVIDSSQNWASRGLFLLADATNPNQPPVAAFTATCSTTSTACTFDASASHDPDGSITGYDWTFGSSSPEHHANSMVFTHDFGTAGTYSVTLTVTDNDGATATSTQTVHVDQSVPTPAFRAVTAACGPGTGKCGSSATTDAVIPNSTVGGDTLLMFVTWANNADTASVPSGWTLLGKDPSGPMDSDVYYRTAATADAGTQVAVNFSAAVKNSVTIADYTGVNPTAAASAHAADTSTATHKTPSVTVPAGGGLAVSFWADKSSSTTAWKAPSGVTTRSTSYDTGGGYVTSLLADSGTVVGPGSYGGLTATTDAASGRGTEWTILLAPAG